MSTNPQTPAGGDAPISAPLRLGIVLTHDTRPTNGELRLLDQLGADDRYEITGLWHSQPGRDGTGLRAAFETRIVPVPPAYPARHWPQPVAAWSGTAEPCDVVIDFCGTAQVTATHGVWTLDSYTPDAGVAAAMAGRPTTSVELLRDVQTVLARAVYDTKFLARRNTEYIREKSVQMIVQALARLHRNGTLPTLPPTPPDTPRASLIGYGTRTVGNVAGRLRDKVQARTGGAPGGFGLRIGHGDVTNFDPADSIELPMPRGHFWADPFLIEHNSDVYCLFEDFDYATGLGHIGAGILTGDGMDYLGQAFVAPHHLSFPLVFHHDGAIYMMPETHQAGRLEIWRATEFPLHWTLHATAFEGQGPADAVLFRQDSDWWLFTGLSQDSFGDFCGEMHLFRVSGPDLTWVEPHPMNPVVIGADTARGGGRVHAVDGRILRLSQDNSGGIYGWGLNVMEITELTHDSYSETRLRHVPPDFVPGLAGCHHFDAAGGRWIMDIRRP